MVYKYILLALILALIDFTYLKTISKHFNTLIKRIQGSTIELDIVASILCYLFLIFGLWYFVLRDKKPIMDAVILGLVVYGVYETTSKAIIKKWDWKTVILDTLWGGILFGLTTYVVRYLGLF